MSAISDSVLSDTAVVGDEIKKTIPNSRKMTHEVRFSSNGRANGVHTDDGDLELTGMDGKHKNEELEDEEVHDHSLEELEGMDGGTLNAVSGLKTEIS